jgi:hypothetical protein
MTGTAKAGWLDGIQSVAVAAKSIAASTTASFLLCRAGKTLFILLSSAGIEDYHRCKS